MFRYGITHSDATDDGIGGFDLARAVTTRSSPTRLCRWLTPSSWRASQRNPLPVLPERQPEIANSRSPEIQVLGAFNGGGARRHDVRHAEQLRAAELHVDDARRRTRGASACACAGRRTTTFATEFQWNLHLWRRRAGAGAGFERANQPCSIARAPALAPITSIERYRRTLLSSNSGYSPAQIRALGGGATQFSIAAGMPELACTRWMSASSPATSGVRART